jgi:hypothetical protein
LEFAQVPGRLAETHVWNGSNWPILFQKSAAADGLSVILFNATGFDRPT